jgi:hypothetical protein
MATSQNPNWIPRKLEEDEIEYPFLVIYRFFDYAGIAHQREHLWFMLKTTVTGTFNSSLLDNKERHNMLYAYEHLERLVEAAHLIHRKRTKKGRYKKLIE